MEIGKQSRDTDVTDESYQGTNRVVASAGYLYLSHLAATVGGMLTLGLAAGIFHKKVNASVADLHTFAEKGGKFRQTIVKFFVGARHGTHELSKVVENLSCEGVSKPQLDKLADLVKKDEMSFFQKKASDLSHSKIGVRLFGKLSESFMSAGFIGASVGAITGWVGSTIWSIHKGTHEGNTGKHQFHRAKEQIKNLQEDNQDLNKINDELHAKYVRAATRLDTIQAAQDAARSELSSTASEAPLLQAAAPTTEVQLDQKQHQGKLAQPELAVA